jgi:formate dehydrogenase accessory protein FdhD
MNPAVHAVEVVRVGPTRGATAADVAATEEPLEIRLGGLPFAVDKVVGAELLIGHVPLSDRILFVSGRTSFEIVQKAVCAGMPIVASASAPSSLAIELARDANVSLLGFVRGGTFYTYSGAERIAL